MTEWAEEVVDRPVLIRRGLRETGWDEASIAAFASEYASLRHEGLPRASRVDRVRELLRMRRREVEGTFTETVDVPLYRFAAPPVRGAKVHYSEAAGAAATGGWSLKFFGVGVGDTTALDVQKAVVYSASDGATKQVYVPVQVRVSQVAVYDGAQLVGRGHVAAVAPPAESGDPLLRKRGIRIVADPPRATAGADGTLAYQDVVDLALAADTTGAVHTDERSWETDVAWELSLSLGSRVDTSALVRVQRTRRLTIASELPAGYDYRGYLCHGFMFWESPVGTTPRRTRRSKGKAA